MVFMIVAENKLVRTMNMGLREQHSSDAEKISDLKTQGASFEPSAKNTKDAEKILNLERQLNSLFHANETSNFLLETTKMKLDESKKENKEQEKELNKLKKELNTLKKELNQLKQELKKYTDKKMSGKKATCFYEPSENIGLHANDCTARHLS
jgi:chromosome segregation ATPase